LIKNNSEKKHLSLKEEYLISSFYSFADAKKSDFIVNSTCKSIFKTESESKHVFQNFISSTFLTAL
jgi:hypothetical protein